MAVPVATFLQNYIIMHWSHVGKIVITIDMHMNFEPRVPKFGVSEKTCWTFTIFQLLNTNFPGGPKGYVVSCTFWDTTSEIYSEWH